MVDRLPLPIVQAPMAGVTSPAMVIAACRAGALGFVAAGMLTPGALRAEIAEVRAGLGGEPFGVNVFMPSAAPADPAAVAAYAERLRPLADRLGAELGEARYETDHFDEKVALLLADPPDVVSFVFGCPSADLVDQFHAAGAAVWVTITQVDEAQQALAVGADALIAQGSEAGGHRGGFANDDRPPVPRAQLLAAVLEAAPAATVVATGAIMDAADVAESLAAGAAAVQVGTALLLSDESTISEVHAEAVAAPGPTVLTRAFTGRRARAIPNAWTRELGPHAPAAYPELHHLGKPLRAKARQDGDRDGLNLWAGERHAEARRLPVASIVALLATRG